MNRRNVALAIVLALTMVNVGGCGTPHVPSNGQPAPPPPSVDPALPTIDARMLPNPLEDPLPAHAKLLSELTGAGSRMIRLTGLSGAAKTVKVRWTCAGSGQLEIKDGAKTLVGGVCSPDLNSATTVFAGEIPRKNFAGLTWRIQTGSAVMWRMAVTATA
jgi:hypothetical protein